MSVTRSKFLPSISENLRLVDALAPTACFVSFALGFLVRCLIVIGFTLLPLSAEPVSKADKHAFSRPPAPLLACEIREVFLPRHEIHSMRQGPVAEKPPRVDRYWPERRLCSAPDLRDPHRWVREQEKEAWRFVDSIDKKSCRVAPE